MNENSKVVSLNAVKKIREAKLQDEAYETKIISMDKVELLNEMVEFQEERSKRGNLTPEMMIKGRILFKALEETADTQALRSLSRSYRKHLQLELDSYMSTQNQ